MANKAHFAVMFDLTRWPAWVLLLRCQRCCCYRRADARPFAEGRLWPVRDGDTRAVIARRSRNAHFRPRAEVVAPRKRSIAARKSGHQHPRQHL